MTFTCPEATIDPSQLGEDYTGTLKLLPTSVLPTDRDSNGILTDSALTEILRRLNTNGVLPNANTSTAAAYREKVKALLNSAKEEYCFYYARYRSSLNYLFASIRNANTNSGSAELGQVVQNRLQTTQTINRKLNDHIQIMNRVTQKLMDSSKELEEQILILSNGLKANKEKLEKQNQIIHSNEASMRLQKHMVKYTEEKSRYSDNLLKMYSFLNIVALGLLVYVYKAAGEE
jgi:hypothetical protein